MTEIEKLLQTAEAEIGYHEKASNSNLDSKTANSGSGNYTKYGRDLRTWIPEAGDTYGINYEWCDQFVDWCFYKAFGKSRAKELLGGWSAYTPTSAQYFKNKGKYDRKPKKGDVVFFYSSSKGRIGHTGIVYKVVDNTVYTIEGNANNQVMKKSYNINDSYVNGFGHPTYISKEDKSTLPCGIVEEEFCKGTLNKKSAVRVWAGKENDKIKSYPTLPKGAVVSVCSYINSDAGYKWYYIKYNGKSGFIYAKNITLEKKTDELNVEKFLKACKKVCDTARTNGYVYGDSRALPPTSDKKISCDRLIAKALWDLAYKDQPTGGITCGNADEYLKKWGFKRSTKLSDARKGSIMLVKHQGKSYTSHMFVFASDFKNGKGDRYDCGSNEYIKSVQPIRNVGFWYRTDSVIVYNI